MTRFFYLFVFATLLVQQGLAQNADVHSERVSADMQVLRSINGASTMGSMAVWPQSVYTLTELANDTASAFASYITDYYGVALFSPISGIGADQNSNRSRFRVYDYSDSKARLTIDAAVQIQPGYLSTSTATSSYLLATPSMRFIGSLNKHLGYFLDLSNGVRLSGDPVLIAKANPVLGRITKFMVEDSSFFDQYIGYVQYQDETMRIRFGREALQFGFSPIDNLVHSIQAPMLDGLLIDVPFSSVRFTMTHSAANGTDTAGGAVPGKYVATHRLAFDPAPCISVAVNDMIVYWGRGIDFAYLNPLAFFVSAGLSTAERNATDNSMLSFDIAVRPVNGTMLYGSIFFDDLNYSTITDTSFNGNTNKWAWQIGASHVISFDRTTTSLLTAEYVHLDPFTYSHRSMNASYTSFQTPLGYNMQPNSDRLALQYKVWFTPRTSIRLDVDYTRHGENILDSAGNIVMGPNPRFPGAISPIGNVGGDILRGDGDDLQGNRFLRGNISYQRRINVWFSAEWMPNIFTDVIAGYVNRNGGNTPEQYVSAALQVRLGY